MVDKIPVDGFKQDPNGENTDWHLGSIVLTSSEYGFAETLNQIIDEMREIKDKVMRLELR